jgi:hypothetical protein
MQLLQSPAHCDVHMLNVLLHICRQEKLPHMPKQSLSSCMHVPKHEVAVPMQPWLGVHASLAASEPPSSPASA